MSERGDRVKAAYRAALADYVVADDRFRRAVGAAGVKLSAEPSEAEGAAAAEVVERLGRETGHDQAFRQLAIAEEALLDWGQEELRKIAGLGERYIGFNLEARYDPRYRRSLIERILEIRG